MQHKTFDEWFEEYLWWADKEKCLKAWQAATAAAIERCVEVCEGERVEAELTGHPEDKAYNTALRHAIEAMRALNK